MIPPVTTTMGHLRGLTAVAQYINGLCLLLLALLLPMAASAHDLEQGGIYYNLESDHAVVAPGTFPYTGNVVIPDAVPHQGHDYPVTAISPAAFRDCSDLTSVYIPSSVTAIGEHAFAGCTALDSVAISDLAAWCRIDFSAESSNPCYRAHHLYLDGEEIIDLVIPDSVTAVNSYAFTGCESIVSVSIPCRVTSIGLSTFSSCPSITSITVAGDNPSYDSRDSCNAIIVTATGILMTGCQKTVIPPTVTAIGSWAFSGCSSLTGIHIPDSVTEIGLESFYNCSSLIGVNIPNSVTRIGYQAFYGCSSLRSIHIPASVRAIGSSALEYCSSLGSISVANGNRRYDSRDDCNAIIETDGNTLIAGCMNTIIPATVEAIDDYAFSGQSALRGIDIPDSVTSVGDYAFRGCSSLRNVSIPEGLTSIGASAFFDCSMLNRIDIPASVSSIGSFALEHCQALYSITVADGNPVYDSRDSCNAIIETATGVLIAGCMRSTIPATVTAIGDNAFSGCIMLTRADIPASVTSIGHYAFTGCSSLSSVSIPNTVTHIGDAAFSGCSALTRLDIPNSVTRLGHAVFTGCSSLESITLPKSMTAIGDYEFYGCSMLKAITIPNSVKSIGEAAFRGCLMLGSISIPKSVTTIGGSAFRECPSLTAISVASGNPGYDSRGGCNAIIESGTGRLVAGCRNTVIPASVTAIGYAAFDGCVFLTDLTIPPTVTFIGSKAFNNCPGLKEVVCDIAHPSLVATAPDAFKLPSGEYADRTLHVPAASASSYQTTAPWSNQFGNIVETPPITKN